jgi:hypothetical protein
MDPITAESNPNATGPHLPGMDLSGDPYLEAWADLYAAARAVREAALGLDGHLRLDFRREGAQGVHLAFDAAASALQAIDDYMRLHRQPVIFRHARTGETYSLPSAGRRIFVYAPGQGESRAMVKHG